MSCHGVSKYKQSVKSIITNAMRYPKMYYRDLYDFRTFLVGYFNAFSELEKIENKDSFDTCFNEWLCHKTDSSGTCGWEYLIRELAKKRNEEPEQLFFTYVQEFLEQWGDKAAK